MSTDEQNLDMQQHAIEKYAEEQNMDLIMYIEKVSSRKTDRTELQNALKAAARGDRFVVYKLDRLARSTKELYQLTDEMKNRGVDFVSIIEDLRNATIEAREVFELSSSILMTVDKATSLLNSVQETMETTLDAVQFWKDHDVNPDIGSNIKEDMGKDLAVSKEEIQNLPDDLAEQSKDSMTSISNVQKELQIIRIA